MDEYIARQLSGALQGFSDMADGHARALRDSTALIQAHTDALRVHAAETADHTRALVANTEAMQDHTRALNRKSDSDHEMMNLMRRVLGTQNEPGAVEQFGQAIRRFIVAADSISLSARRLSVGR